MPKIKTTDILLFLILLSFLANILIKGPITKATAETFKLDDCITPQPTDKPAAYLHVISH